MSVLKKYLPLSSSFFPTLPFPAFPWCRRRLVLAHAVMPSPSPARNCARRPQQPRAAEAATRLRPKPRQPHACISTPCHGGDARCVGSVSALVSPYADDAACPARRVGLSTRRHRPTPATADRPAPRRRRRPALRLDGQQLRQRRRWPALCPNGRAPQLRLPASRPRHAAVPPHIGGLA
jgi:hypothetical protein